jgi:hypothetical protein
MEESSAKSTGLARAGIEKERLNDSSGLFSSNHSLFPN